MIRESKLSLDMKEFYTAGRGLQAGCSGVDRTRYRVETVTKQTGPITVFRKYKVVRDRLEAVRASSGTAASVICRLEDANYDGHSLATLNRIVAALNQRVEIRFVPPARRWRSA